jgi:plasmid stabilization system protein ParE
LSASKFKIQWRSQAYDDLKRLYDFLAPDSPQVALQTVDLLLQAVRGLPAYPRIGSKLVNYRNREVRKLSIGSYELRYELKEDRIVILRFWHGREKR